MSWLWSEDNMLKFIVVFALFVVMCHSEEGTTKTPESRVYCGIAPNNIYTCLQSPRIINRTALSKCKSNSDECSLMNCIFRASGWLNDADINKDKIKESFEKFAAENPVWSTAVQYLKINCLERDLKAQGVDLNCPAYDVMLCIQHSFLRNAPASQWLSKEECVYSRSYAEHCPLCPNDCFAPAVPIGSCNACLVLPRSP